MKFLAALLVYLILAQNAGAVFISNTYIGGGGQALATQTSSTGLVQLGQSSASSAGVTVGSGILNFAKTGNEILSGYPFYYSSDNGASFSAQTVDLSSPTAYTQIDTDGTYWLAGGTISGQGKVANSSNRANWTAVSLSSCTSLYWIANGGGKYVATGMDSASSQGRIWYSTDRASWTKTDGGLAFGISGGQLRYGNGYFLTAGGGSATIERAAASSITSWSEIALAESVGNAGKIAYSTVNSRWVIAGIVGGLFKIQYSDDDGATWTAATVPTPIFTMSAINNVVALADGGFIAVGVTAGGYGAAIHSADGITWTNISNAASFQGLYGIVAQ